MDIIQSAEVFEKENVYDVYEEISKHFDQTRYVPWPKVKEFTDTFNKNSIIADVGCGNGKNCLINQNLTSYVGFEIVDSFINICKKKGITMIKSNITNIQSSNNIFTHTMCIAVLHHLCNEERRIKAIQELIRITQINGKILIYVWAKEQEKFKNEIKKDVFVPWNMQKKYNKDCEYVYYRYYHLFENGELEKLIEKSNVNVNIIEKGMQKDNYYILLEKI